MAILRTVWAVLVVRNTVYRLTSQRLTKESGVLNKRIESIELYRIKDMSFDQPFIARLLRLGSVRLVTSDATTRTMMLPYVPKARVLFEKIRDLVEEIRRRRLGREMDLAHAEIT